MDACEDKNCDCHGKKPEWNLAEEISKVMALENSALQREVVRLREAAMRTRESEALRKRHQIRREGEIDVLNREAAELMKQLNNAHQTIMKLQEQVEVLKRDNEINEKQIRDYERANADIMRPLPQETPPMTIIRPMVPDGPNSWKPMPTPNWENSTWKPTWKSVFDD